MWAVLKSQGPHPLAARLVGAVVSTLSQVGLADRKADRPRHGPYELAKHACRPRQRVGRELYTSPPYLAGSLLEFTSIGPGFSPV